MEAYFKRLEKQVEEAYRVAKETRNRGLDPYLSPEIPLAKDLAERVEGLVGPAGISERIREVDKELSREEAAIKIAREIVEGRHGTFKGLEEAFEQALRTSLAILTEGIVAAPLEGIAKVRIKKNADRTAYLAVYFAGPIRSAGGSAQAMAVLIGDYIRTVLGLGRYKPKTSEIERFAEETDLYNREAARLQYLPTSEEVRTAISNIPIEITGEGTEKVEVMGHRDIERIETNQLRGGAVLVLAEGVLQKAPKIIKYVKKLDLEGWEWLEDFVAVKNKSADENIEIGPSHKYIKDLIAGRPVISYPSEKGGLRLRYGRCRTSGLASASLHPATMVLLDGFIAVGTQIKTERPGKGAAVSPCDTIEGPIVKLNDGSVVRVETEEDAHLIKDRLKEILFVGDILISYGDFLENNHVLMPAGYCEEWWARELEKALDGDEAEVEFLTKNPTQEEAIELAEKLNIPLHPRYTYFYHNILKEDLKTLVEWLCEGELEDGFLAVKKGEGRRILETLGVPFEIKGNKVILREYKPLLRILGIQDLDPSNFFDLYKRKSKPMEMVNSFGIKVREKAPTYIGARMGRPEKAKERKMSPPVNVLFPVGQNGGRTRDVKKAAEMHSIEVEVARRECPRCGGITFETICSRCNEETKLRRTCVSCGRISEKESCEACGASTRYFEQRKVEIKALFDEATAKAGKTSNDIKGVIGMTSTYKIPEPLEKGILRAKHRVFVFKDGTTRFDATDVPLTHFRPKEIGVSIERLKELGYDRDKDGNILEHEDQILELKVQDIIVPEDGAKYLLNSAKFLDELLEKLYGVESFYNAEGREDLIGHLVIGLAPHTSAAILGRIIGFSKTRVGYAHPFFHAAKRRNCLLPETEVLIFNNECPTLKTLEEIYRDEVSTSEISDDFSTKEKKIDLKILALNPENNEFEIKKIRSIIKAHSPKNLIMVKSRTGREIITTLEHRHLVFKDNKPIFKRGIELSDKDLLVLPEKLEIEEQDKKEVDIILEFDELNPGENLMVRGIDGTIRDLVRSLGGLKETSRKLQLSKKTFSNYIYRDSVPLLILKELLELAGQDLSFIPADCWIGFKRDAISIPRFINTDREFSRLVGYYLAEGHARAIPKGCYQIDFAATEEEIRNDIESIVKKIFGIKPSCDGARITISSRAVYHLFVDILKIGKDARDKRIPKEILALPKFKIRELLRAYFAGDGSVEKGRLHVTCSSVNEGLLRDIGFLLLRFGIFYRIKSEEREPTGVLKNFYAKKKLEPSFKLKYLSIRSTYAKKFYNEVGFSLTRKQESLERVIKKERAPRLKKIGSLILDPIREITIEKCTTGFVYDITVEEHHNFLINDFVVTGNCDGDEDAIILLLDALINFSKAYLPSSRGGKMDAPLVLTTRLDPKEIDDEAHNLDVLDQYPLEFYEKTLEYARPQDLGEMMEIVKNRLGKPEQYFGINFTHDTSDISAGPSTSTYKLLTTMKDKVEHQLELARKIRAVDNKDVAKKVIEGHFLPDLAGNLRAFSTQKTRCVSCNTKYRRVPLGGKCRRCGGKLILTVSRGSVEKYLEVTKEMLENYGLDDYLKQRVEILEMGICSVFDNDAATPVRQISLSDFFS